MDEKYQGNIEATGEEYSVEPADTRRPFRALLEIVFLVPCEAMLVAQDVDQRCKELDITILHNKLRATGDNKTKTPDSDDQSAIRVLARSGMKTGRIEDMTPIPTDRTRRKGGRRGKIL